MAKKVKNVEVGSAFDLLGKSFEIVSKNWQIFLLVSLPAIFWGLAPAFDDNSSTSVVKYDNGTYIDYSSSSSIDSSDISLFGLGLTLILILSVVSYVLYLMTLVLHVNAVQGKIPSASELFRKSIANWLWLKVIGLWVLSALIIVVGLILLIVPGVIAFGRLIMASYFMVDKNLSVTEAIKASNQMSKQFPGKVWAVIGVWIVVCIGLAIVGIIPVVGAIVGVAATFFWQLILALRYQQLKGLKTVTVEK